MEKLKTKARKSNCFQNIIISILQREYSDADEAIFITVTVIERKQREPSGAGAVISLSCHQQKKSEVMFIFCGGWYCSLNILLHRWGFVYRRTCISALLAHTRLRPPGWVNVACVLIYTVGSLRDDLILSENDMNGGFGRISPCRRAVMGLSVCVQQKINSH